MADVGLQLRREAQVAPAAVRLTDRNDGWMAAHPAEGVVREQERFRNGVAEGGSTLLESADEGVRQRHAATQMPIGRGEFLESANGLIHLSTVHGGPGLRLRLEFALRLGDGQEDGIRVGRVEKGSHGLLAGEHLRELVQPGKV